METVLSIIFNVMDAIVSQLPITKSMTNINNLSLTMNQDSKIYKYSLGSS